MSKADGFCSSFLFIAMVNDLRKPIWRGRFIRYAPLFLWVGLILFLSTGQGAISNTSRFIRPLLEFLFPNSPEEILLTYHNYIRKLAHATEYAGLAFFAARAFSSSSVRVLEKFWYVFSISLVLLTALVDEYNQSFNPARTASIYDVWLDVTGGFFMLLLILVFKSKSKNNYRLPATDS
jgi:VanZ family protein